MSSEPTTKEIVRTTQVLEVMGLLFSNEKITVQNACDQIGIKIDNYYYWVRREPDALKAVREYLAETQKYELSVLSAAVTQINLGLVETALNDDTEAADKLRIAKYLSAEAEKLQRIYQVVGGSEEAAEFLKSGPELSKKESRFASMAVTQEDDGAVKVDFYREDTIIEGVEVDESLDKPD